MDRMFWARHPLAEKILLVGLGLGFWAALIILVYYAPESWR